MRRRLVIWLPVVLWMALIFVFSAMPDIDSSRQSGRIVSLILGVIRWLFGETAARTLQAGLLERVVRKAAHFTEYAVLCLLAQRAFRREGCRHPFRLAVGLCVIYAAGDEFHQFFVPGRSMQAGDVAIDTVGAMTGGAAGIWVRKITGK